MTASYADEIRRAAGLFRASRYSIALTGAGVSTPSGISDFRSPECGLWQQVNPFEVASLYGFLRKPEAFYDWIRPLAATVRDAKPNLAHIALASLENAGHLQGIITQNIDMLHTRAGSHRVYEVHGHLREATCIECYHVVEARPHLDALVEYGTVPRCSKCNGIMKPNVVLIGEQLPAKAVRDAQQAARKCELMLVAGSSLTVTPAAGLPRLASANGARLVVVNYEPTYIDGRADVVIHDDVADILPRLVEELESR